MRPIKTLVVRSAVIASLVGIGFSARNANAVPTGLCTYTYSVTTSCQGNMLCNTKWYVNLPYDPSCTPKGPDVDCFWTEECANVSDYAGPGDGYVFGSDDDVDDSEE